MQTQARSRAALTALVTGMFMQGCCSLSVIAMAREVAADFGRNASAGGLLLAAYAGPAAVAAPILQWRLTGRRLDYAAQASLGLGLLAIGTLLSAFSRDFVELLVCRAISGIGGALYMPTCGALASASAPDGARGRALGLVSSGFSATHVIGIPLAAVLTQAFGWRACFIAISVTTASVLLAAIATLPRTQMTSETSKAQERSLALLLARPAIRGLGTTALTTAGRLTLIGAFATLLVDTFALTGHHLPAALAAVGIAGVAGTVLGGRIADAIGARTAALAGLLLTASITAALTLPLSTAAALSAVIAVAFAGSAASLAVQVELLKGIAPERYGLVLSANTTALAVGMTIGSAVSAIVATFGYQAIVLVSAALLLVAMLTAREPAPPTPSH